MAYPPTAIKAILSPVHAEPASINEEGPPFEAWREDAVWTLPEGDRPLSGGSTQVLENRVHQSNGRRQGVVLFIYDIH